MQHDLATAAFARRLHQGIEHGTADAAAAQGSHDRHPADPRHARSVLEQPPGGQRQAEPVAGERMHAGRVGFVPFHRRRNALLIDEHGGADRLRITTEFGPAADADVDHRLAGLEAQQDLAQFRWHRPRGLRARVGEDVDEFAADQEFVLTEHRRR